MMALLSRRSHQPNTTKMASVHRTCTVKRRKWKSRYTTLLLRSVGQSNEVGKNGAVSKTPKRRSPMSWEYRGSNRYYTRTRRQNGRVIREYVGTGQLADIAAYQDFMLFVTRRERSSQDRTRLEEIKAAKALLKKVRMQVWSQFLLAMAEFGFHLHARSTWRKRRRILSNLQIQGPEAEMKPYWDTGDDSDPLLRGMPDSSWENPAEDAEANSQKETDPISDQSSNPVSCKSGKSSESQNSVTPSTAATRKIRSKWIELISEGRKAVVDFIRDDLNQTWATITHPDDPKPVLLLAELYLDEWLKKTYFEIQLGAQIQGDTPRSKLDFLRKSSDSASRMLVLHSKQILEIRQMLKANSRIPNEAAVSNKAKGQTKMKDCGIRLMNSEK